jgi:signal peptidase II
MKCESTNKNSLLLIILLILVDQLAKYIIRSSGGFYICNKGIAFGIILPSWLILALAIALTVFTGFIILNFLLQAYPIERKFKISNLALALVLSGAISNLIDRVYYGCVIDFIDLKIWPVFNPADIFICLGAFLLIIKLNKK